MAPMRQAVGRDGDHEMSRASALARWSAGRLAVDPPTADVVRLSTAGTGAAIENNTLPRDSDWGKGATAAVLSPLRAGLFIGLAELPPRYRDRSILSCATSR